MGFGLFGATTGTEIWGDCSSARCQRVCSSQTAQEEGARATQLTASYRAALYQMGKHGQFLLVFTGTGTARVSGLWIKYMCAGGVHILLTRGAKRAPGRAMILRLLCEARAVFMERKSDELM